MMHGLANFKFLAFCFIMKVSAAETKANSLQQDLWFAFSGREKYMRCSQREKCPLRMQFCKACFILKVIQNIVISFELLSILQHLL